MNNKIRKAINWNNLNREDTQLYWNQGIRQFWIDEEIPLADDKLTWDTLSDDEKDAYKKIFATLTLLDTEQGNYGTPNLMSHIEDLGVRSVLSYFTFMEHMHAKSYSSIFSTLCSTKEIDDLFKWVEETEVVQKKINIIKERYYSNIEDTGDMYMAMVSSVFLENFMFYSGFFYPLYLSARGKLVSSGEIINLIIRDEVMHGMYMSNLASELYNTFTMAERNIMKKQAYVLMERLVDNEIEYTKMIYNKLGLTDQVIKYVKHRANVTLKGLGLNNIYDIEENEIESSVLAGLDTKTKNHDFFSTKGNGYIKQTNVEELDDNDFMF